DPRRVPITVDDVTVHFADRAEPALDRLSLTVRPGEILAITGPSGCGKSTVANLLLGFVTPSAGRIRIGDVELADLDLDAWRRVVAYVPQRSYLFAGTVAENIALGTCALDPAAVERAALAAGLNGLPRGLSTPVD